MPCCDVPPKKPLPARQIPPFYGFTAFTPTIPKLYWDVKSQEQRILRICDLLDKLICYSDFLGEEINVTKDDIEFLKSEFEEFKEHGFEDYYLEQIEKWINDNLETILHVLIRQVYFGLNLEGRFIAIIPDSWSDIVFDTGMVYELDTYGRLILRMDVDSPYDHVDQTPEVVRSSGQYTQLRRYVENIMHTLYTTEGDSNGS